MDLLDPPEALTLREAAARTSRSITTLRRYIRSRRLAADKRRGRFGPEYFVQVRDLVAAGFDADLRPDGPAPRSGPPRELAATAERPADAVPLALYQELQMKHEQLLVQYGMVRVGGLHVIELRAELEARQRQLDEAQSRVARLRQQYAEETARLRQLLRQAELEQHGRALEIAALQEKVRALELLRPMPAPAGGLERQIGDFLAQSRRLERLSAPRDPEPGGPEVGPEQDH